MADKNIQMTQRNATNDGWDNLNPITKAANVKFTDGTDVEAHKADTTAHDILKKFGATATGGTLDWNDITNTKPGTSPTLLYGDATNGPGPHIYFHCLNFEYATKDGSGNISQIAIPYAGAASTYNMYMRGKSNGVWSAWQKILITADYSLIRIDSTNKLRAEVKSSAPSSPTNGDIWYDSTNHKFKGYANGAWV